MLLLDLPVRFRCTVRKKEVHRSLLQKSPIKETFFLRKKVRCELISAKRKLFICKICGYGVALASGPIKLHFSFAKEPYNRVAILQKSPII